MTEFSDYHLDPAILAALEKMHYKNPSPIQAQTIPVILQGYDLIALAQTGSGKTAACAIPICHKVCIQSLTIQALIIVPTRELAVQYAVETQKIGHVKGVRVFSLCGGESMELQQSKLRAGVHVLIATPGRLIDFIYQRLVDLSSVETLILDEADEMLSMGFYDDLEFIIQCLVHSHQTLLFSATMPKQIRKIALQHMQSPLEITISQDQGSPKLLEHKFIFCPPQEVNHRLLHLLKEMQPPQVLIFCKSRVDCETLCRLLQRHLDKVDFLHAGLSQETRSIITNKFRNGKITCLVATDIAARGLDFSRITHVFMHHLPTDPEVYLHRAGRTGRNDKEGVAVTFVTPRDLPTLQRVLKLIQREAVWIGEPPVIRPAVKLARRVPARRVPHKPNPNN